MDPNGLSDPYVKVPIKFQIIFQISAKNINVNFCQGQIDTGQQSWNDEEENKDNKRFIESSLE